MTKTKSDKMLDAGGKSVVAADGGADGSHLRLPAECVDAVAGIDDDARGTQHHRCANRFDVDRVLHLLRGVFTVPAPTWRSDRT